MNAPTPTSASILFHARAGDLFDIGALKRNVDISAQRAAAAARLDRVEKIEKASTSRRESPEMTRPEAAKSPDTTRPALGKIVDIYV